LRVAVFARSLDRRPTGRGVYAFEMLQELGRSPGLALEVFSGEPPPLPNCNGWPARGRSRLEALDRLVGGIARDLARIRPDILWCTTHLVPLGLPAALPRVVTLHDLVWRDHPETLDCGRRLLGRSMEHLLAGAQRIACVSEFTRGRLEALWPELAPKAVVIPNAASTRRSAPHPGSDFLRRLGIDRPFVLNVDTIEPRKGLGTLLDAMAELPDLLLVQCGQVGWKAAALGERAARAQNVRLLGYADRATLTSLYRAARAAVFPSIYEGFHLGPLEAAKEGCPVVLSDIPVHREVLGEAARYFPPGDARALALRLREAAHDEDRASWASRARERAELFSWKVSAARLIRVFHEVLDGPESIP
jgi:glycosyltransferase involved in cell wall biosynthesis